MRRFIPHWRKMTWVLVLWTGLMLVWIIGGATSADTSDKDCGTLSKEACEGAQDAGTAIGVGLLIFLWFLGFVVLSLVWFMSRPRERS